MHMGSDCRAWAPALCGNGGGGVGADADAGGGGGVGEVAAAGAAVGDAVGDSWHQSPQGRIGMVNSQVRHT